MRPSIGTSRSICLAGAMQHQAGQTQPHEGPSRKGVHQASLSSHSRVPDLEQKCRNSLTLIHQYGNCTARRRISPRIHQHFGALRDHVPRGNLHPLPRGDLQRGNLQPQRARLLSGRPQWRQAFSMKMRAVLSCVKDPLKHDEKCSYNSAETTSEVRNAWH